MQASRFVGQQRQPKATRLHRTTSTKELIACGIVSENASMDARTDQSALLDSPVFGVVPSIPWSKKSNPVRWSPHALRAVRQKSLPVVYDMAAHPSTDFARQHQDHIEEHNNTLVVATDRNTKQTLPSLKSIVVEKQKNNAESFGAFSYAAQHVGKVRGLLPSHTKPATGTGSSRNSKQPTKI
jgi:hypothetical protein